MGSPIHLRVDLHAAAWRVTVGHRIAVTLSTAGEHGASGRPATGVVAFAPESHVVLPTDDGLGAPPLGTYPPRPFAHDWTRWS